MSPTTPIPPAAVDALRRTVDGLVAYPTDPAYDVVLSDPRAPDGRADVVVVPSTEAAVGAAVDVARAHGLHITGRGPAAAPTMLVLTHRLDGVVVDPHTRTATVGAGATWADLEARLAGSLLQPPHDLADPLAGIVSAACAGTVAALAARVVRADGFVQVVDDPRPATDQVGPWIVTAVVLQLHPVTTTSLVHDTTERIPS